MATIFRGGVPIQTEDGMIQAEQYAISYWGNLNLEKIFPIAFWKAKQMISASNSKKIALRISDINDPLNVDGSWMVFDEAQSDLLADPNEENISYFLLEDSLFDGPVLVPNGNDGFDRVEGISKVNNTPYNNIIRGRIGKDALTNKTYAFFQAAGCDILGPGGGGEGASTGFKIPSPG